MNEAGKRKLGEILNKECEKLMSLDENSVNGTSDKAHSQVQVVSESGAAPQVLDRADSNCLEGSFLGFPREN